VTLPTCQSGCSEPPERIKYFILSRLFHFLICISLLYASDFEQKTSEYTIFQSVALAVKPL
jgi:hypothetical protein